METLTSKQDINGKFSAKRKWAGRYLLAGLVWPLMHYAAGLFLGLAGRELKIDFPLEIWYGLIGGGFAALGLTVFESKIK